jgi:hypothetical protein
MKKSLLRWPALAGLAFMLQACATAGTGGVSSSPGAPLRDRTLITADEIAALYLPDLHAVVRTLHPEWLTSGRGAVGVFLNGVRRGGPEALSSIATTGNVQIRYLNERAIVGGLSPLSREGLAAAILVEEGTQARLSSPNTALPPEMQLKVAVYATYPTTEMDDPFDGQSEYVLASESENEETGWTAAVRLSYRGIYVQPFYLTGSEYDAVYQRRNQIRNIGRTIDPRVGIIAGYEYGPIRAGAGVMMENSTWNWSAGECECTSIGADKTSEIVPVAEVAARARLWRMVGAELRVTGSQRPATDFYVEQFYPATFVRQSKTTVVDVAFGLSARLF